MKNTSLKVLTLVAVLTTAGLVIAETGDSEATLNQIVGYRQWTRINEQPFAVVTDLASVAI
jgi:hypothetical protein